MRDNRKSTIKIKNKILAIDVAPAAIPPKPKTAAIMAITRKVMVQRSIIVDFKFKNYSFSNSSKENIMPFYYTENY